MNPYLALLVSLGLSFFCLRRDAQLQKNVSPAIWLAVIWMMRCASRSFALWFGQGDVDESEDSSAALMDPIILLGFTLLGINVLRQRSAQLKTLFRENIWLLLFLAYLTVSVLWSDDIYVAFKRWVRAAGDVTMALVVATEISPFSALVCVIRRSALVLIPLSLVLCKYFPDIGRLTSKSWSEPDAWIGVSNDKNWLGVLCFLAAACFLWNWVMRKRETGLGLDIRVMHFPFEILFLAMAVYLLFGGGAGRAKSVTAIILFALSILVFLLLDYCRKRNIRVLRLAVIIFATMMLVNGVCLLIAGASLTDLVIEAMGRNPNLTDRTAFWPFLLEQGMKHPVFGTGFASFWTPQIAAGVKAIIHIAPNQAHNGYLEVFLNVGAVGVLLLVLSLYGSLKGAFRLMQHDFEFARVRLILLLSVMLDNWTEASFSRPTQLVWLIFLFSAINVVPTRENSNAEGVKMQESGEEPVLEQLVCSRRLASQ